MKPDRNCRLLAPGELTECLQWALPHYSPDRAGWILNQVNSQVAAGRTSQIIAAVATAAPCEAITRESLLAAAVATQQSASAATLLLLQAKRAVGSAELIGELLEPVLQRLRGGGITFLQAACDHPDQGELLRQAGFVPLADLSLLALPHDDFVDARARAEAITAEHRQSWPAAAQWVSLAAIGEQGMTIFSTLAAQTFIDTCDCPLLSDFRTAEEIAQGYPAAAKFDPALCRLLRLDDQWAGCLVLTHHAQTPGGSAPAVSQPAAVLELTYMGLTPQYRRRQLSASLLAETIRLAQALQASQVVLAVDQANRPAMASYRRLGWQDVAQESVWGRRV